MEGSGKVGKVEGGLREGSGNFLKFFKFYWIFSSEQLTRTSQCLFKINCHGFLVICVRKLLAVWFYTGQWQSGRSQHDKFNSIGHLISLSN